MRTLALSDLHLGRSSSRILRPESLAALVAGFDRVLLLGDVVDEWYVTRAQAHDLAARVRVTVLHEVGHYFGMTDERLHEMGWA